MCRGRLKEDMQNVRNCRNNIYIYFRQKTDHHIPKHLNKTGQNPLKAAHVAIGAELNLLKMV